MSSRRSILVVDDEEIVRTYLIRFLEKSGWQVSAAADGTSALSQLERTVFDVILCDLDLGPGLDGSDVLKNRPEQSARTPFVILTGHGTIGRCRDALMSGAVDFLEKPISSKQLLAALDRVVGHFPRRVQTPTADDVQLEAPSGPEVVGHLRVRRGLEVIESRYSECDFGVSNLAEELGVTPEHLSRLFRTHLHRSPLEQIHVTRIGASAQILENVKLSIYEVARDCGYKSTRDFARWFRRFNGLTPSEWRGSGPHSSPLSVTGIENHKLDLESD